MVPTRSPAQLAVSAARAAGTQACAESMRDHLIAALEGQSPSNRQVAAVFNRKGLRTRTGERWWTSPVAYLRQRLGIEKSKSNKTGD
jgi:hypothetical protein